ncbi:MAG: hypothetical protein OXR82_17470 [Gammaproteobacteria bacterium]|nr:hypothetical protein [Gammaproteobacteria bacterium]
MADRFSNAEGQYLGYSLQLGRLLALLLEGRESTAVALEHLGDVSMESDGSLSRIEEHKSRTSQANPISDRAVDLWKTLKNWMDLVEGGLVPDEIEFRMHINRNFSSNFATKFHEASDPLEVRALVNSVVEYFEKSPPGEVLARFVDPVLKQSRRHTLHKILQAFRLSHGSGSSREDLLDLLRRTVVPEEHLTDVLHSLLGWLKLVTDSQLEQNEAAVVFVVAFRAELRATVRKLDRQTVLNSYSLAPTAPEVKKELQSRTFVRQLELVDEADVLKLRAVRDFLKARADRIHWANRSLVHRSDFVDLESSLEAVWSSKRAIVSIRDDGRPEADQGRLLLHECLQHRCRLHGRETPSYFTAGSFHSLADEQTVGWHPRYLEILALPSAAEET